MIYLTAVTEAKYKLESEPTKYTPYLTLMGELWDVFCEDLGENLCHNCTALNILKWDWNIFKNYISNLFFFLHW